MAEALIPAEKEGAITALVDTGQRHRSAKGEAEFIAGEGRDAARVRLRPAVEKIARVERCIAQKLKQRAVQLIGT